MTTNKYTFINKTKILRLFRNTGVILLVIIIISLMVSAIGKSDSVLELQSPIIVRSPFKISPRTSKIEFIEIKKQDASVILEIIKQETEVKKVKAQEIVPVTLEERILNKFGNGKDAKIMLAIAKAESSLNCNAHGDKHLKPSSYGLFQIRAFSDRLPHTKKLDCDKNIEQAYVIYKEQGFTPWSTYKNGAYKQYLK